MIYSKKEKEKKEEEKKTLTRYLLIRMQSRIGQAWWGSSEPSNETVDTALEKRQPGDNNGAKHSYYGK